MALRAPLHQKGLPTHPVSHLFSLKISILIAREAKMAKLTADHIIHTRRHALCKALITER